MSSSPIIERVKKLLALSQSDVPAERDAALAKANALIAEHNIDAVLLQGSDKPESFEELQVELGRRLPPEAKYVAWLIQRHFRCEVTYGNRFVPGQGYVRTFDVLGRKSDAEFARWLVGYLFEEFRRRWSYYRASHSVPTNERGTYIYGLYKGLDARLTEERQAAEAKRIGEIAAEREEQTPKVDFDTGTFNHREYLGDKYALAVQDEKEQRSTELRRRHPHLRTVRSRVNVRSGSVSLLNGITAGRTISVARPIAA